MNVPQQIYHIIPPILRNKYALTLCLFVLWLLFFDSNTVWSQWQMRQAIQAMQEKITHYHNEVNEVKKSLNDLQNNDASIEQFAREKYLMKRPNEDIFIISKE